MPSLPSPDPADVAVPGAVTDVRRPRYGTRSLADVVPAVTSHLLGPEDVHPLAADLRTDRVVVLVVDGLGALQLAAHSDLAPTLTTLPGDDIDAVFATTTVTSLASIGTGRPPSQHGLLGYTVPLPDHDHPLNGLGWRVGLRGGGWDARTTVVPEHLLPDPTAFERAAEAGIATTVVLAPGLPDSGLTRAVLRGGERRTARGLAATLDLAVAAVSRGDAPALAYAYHPLVDWAGHTSGPGSEDWCEAVRDVDRELTALRDRVPADVTVLVTADHGMLHVREEEIVELADEPDLLDGVRTVAGEPRVRHLALEDGASPDEVAARWRDRLGDRVLVLTGADALPLYGPDPTTTARRHVGDLVVIARRGTVAHERVDPHGGRHPGQHGGPSRAEMLVPLRRLEAG